MTPGLRFYEAVELDFPDGVLLPAPNTTTAVPSCILCQRLSPLPPSRLGWLPANGDKVLFQVCGECYEGDTPELKAKIIAKVRGEPPAVTAIAAE